MKLHILENPETGTIIFLNKIIKINKYDRYFNNNMYKYSILTTDNNYTDIFSSYSNWQDMIREYRPT